MARVPLLLLVCLLAAPSADALIGFDAFGPHGEGGSLNGQTLTLGAGGSVFELDAFLAVDGLDLNPSPTGTAAQLSLDPLPTGLGFDFSAMLSADATDLVLTYSFTNDTGAALGPVTFLSFVDAEIDAAGNGFANEFASVSGTLAAGQGFEVDEPGFVFGDIFDHLEAGVLDDSNALPPGTAEDVSMALSFGVAGLAAGDRLVAEIQLSEDGDGLGSFRITQQDSDPQSTTAITYSGRASVAPAVPEPGAALVFAAGLVVAGVARRRA